MDLLELQKVFLGVLFVFDLEVDDLIMIRMLQCLLRHSPGGTMRVRVRRLDKRNDTAKEPEDGVPDVENSLKMGIKTLVVKCSLLLTARVS